MKQGVAKSLTRSVGVVMPVLPLHINEALGMSSLVVGIVAGAPFVAALLTRPWAGGIVDTGLEAAFLLRIAH